MKSKADRYIDDVLRRVVLPSARRETLRADLYEHFAAAEEGAEPVEEIIRRLGAPEEVAASFMEGVELRYSAIWPRLVAFVADVGILILSLVPAAVLGLALAGHVSGDGSPSPLAFLLFCFFALFALAAFGTFLLYFPFLEHFFGWTLGKRIMKLRVVTEQGAQIGLGAAFIRRLPIYFELFWLDCVFAPFTEKKQRAFDMVAKTVVIEQPDERRTLLEYLLCLAPWIALAMVLVFLGILGAFST